MPYIPPYLMQEQQVAPRSSSVSYGNIQEAFKKQEGEGDFDYLNRLSTSLLPLTRDILAGKPPAQQIAILENQRKLFSQYLSNPLLGPVAQYLIEGLQGQIDALKPAAAADSKIQAYKVVGFGLLAASALLGVTYGVFRAAKAFKSL
jgi:hypothetical protein